MKKLVIFIFSVLSFTGCGGESDTVVPVSTTVSTTTVVPVATTVSTTTVVPVATTTSAVIKELELTAACTFDDSIPQISCQALGITQGSQLRWESNIAGWTTGPSYQIKLVEQHQIVPEVKVTLQECRASDCTIVENVIDTSVIVSSDDKEILPKTENSTIDLKPEKANCPDDFAGWFKTFPLEDHTLIYEVGPPGRIDPDAHRGHGYFRLPTGMNEVNVRMPVDGTLYMGSNHYENAANAVSEERVIQYRLEFRTECEGLRFRFDHIAEPVPKIVELFTREPLLEGSYGMNLEPLFLREGELVGTKIGIETNGNAFVDFGVYDDFKRVRTAEDQRFYNAACFYEFFSTELVEYLRSRISRVDNLEEGLCPPSASTNSQPSTGSSSPSELVASCIFDNVEHYLNCEATGGRGGSLTWSSNVPGMGTDFGSTYSRQLEWGLVLDEISVDLEECIGSECTTITNNLDLDLQPRGSCPNTFDGWFTTFPLNEIGEIIEVEAAARLIGATFEQPGVFRLPYGQNNVEVRLPINATLAYGLKYSTVSNLNNANPEEVPELQYGLRFQTECEGLWFTIDHMQTLTPELTSYFDNLPVETSATTKKIGPLVMQEGDLVGTTIGFPIDGNAFVAFGIFDEYKRVATAGPDFLNAVCFYDFFSSDIASQLRAKTVDRWPVAEGLLSC